MYGFAFFSWVTQNTIFKISNGRGISRMVIISEATQSGLSHSAWHEMAQFIYP